MHTPGALLIYALVVGFVVMVPLVDALIQRVRNRSYDRELVKDFRKRLDDMKGRGPFA